MHFTLICCLYWFNVFCTSILSLLVSRLLQLYIINFPFFNCFSLQMNLLPSDTFLCSESTTLDLSSFNQIPSNDFTDVLYSNSHFNSTRISSNLSSTPFTCRFVSFYLSNISPCPQHY